MNFTLLKKKDLFFINKIRNEFAAEYLHDSRTFSLKETKKWFKKNKPNYWIIWKDNVRIGYFRLSNYSKQNRNIYIGADIHKDYQGYGYGYESYVLFINFIFKTYNLHKISLEVLETNERAINLYKKLGFKEEGIKRQEVLKKDLFVNSIIMSILNSEWYEK